MSFENGDSPITPQITGPLFNTAPKKSSKTGDSLINDDDTPYVSRSRLCGQVAPPILQTEAPGILPSAVLGSRHSALIHTAEGALSAGETEASGLQGHLRKFPGKTICPLPFGATAAHLLHAPLPPEGLSDLGHCGSMAPPACPPLPRCQKEPGGSQELEK